MRTIVFLYLGFFRTAFCRFVVVTFHTSGPPHDFGLDLTEDAKRFVDIVGPHCDALYVYNFSSLRTDPWWTVHFHDYPDVEEWTLPMNKGANHIGYWKYKALILYRTLELEPDLSSVMYLDTGKLQAQGVGEWRSLAREVLFETGAEIWIGYEAPPAIKVKHHCKSLTVRNITNSSFAERIFERSLLVCNRIIVRNTQAMRTMFRDEILPLFQRDELLVPTKTNEWKHVDLRWETGDQAIWNAFLYNLQYEGRLPQIWPRFATGKSFHRQNEFVGIGLKEWSEDGH